MKEMARELDKAKAVVIDPSLLEGSTQLGRKKARDVSTVPSKGTFGRTV